MQQYKVEILLPKTYNDRRPIEGKKYRETYQEIFIQFNGCTQDNTPLLGAWRDPRTKKKYNDTNICYWVVCNDSIDNTYFLDDLKIRLKERFDQEDIMMYHTLINII